MKKNSLKKFLGVLFLFILAGALTCSAALAEEAPAEEPLPGFTVPQSQCSHPGTMRLLRYSSYEEPTCTLPGFQIAEMVCDYCGMLLTTYRQDVSDKPALGHAWDYREIPSSCAGDHSGQERYCTRCGAVEVVSEAAGHDWHTVTYTAATCKEHSGTYEQCSKCGAKRNEQYNSGLYVHTYTTKPEVVQTAASCAQRGVFEQECDCGETTRIGYYDKLPHQWVDGQVDATCSSAGYHYKQCQSCGAMEKGEIIPRNDALHKWVTYTESPSSCTRVGIERRRCSACGMVDPSYSKELPMKGHVSGGWVKYDKNEHVKKCQVCGEILERQAHIPDGDAASVVCTGTVRCTVCGYGIATGTGHNWKWQPDPSNDLVHVMVCVNCGKTGSTELHRFNSSDCTQSATCSTCGAVHQAQQSHRMGAWSRDNDSTHSRKCLNSGCKYTETEAHQWSEWKLVADHSLARSCPGCHVSQSQYTSAVITPTPRPTAVPTAKPTAAPTAKPTTVPTAKATVAPAAKATATPTAKPAATHTAAPTVKPTATHTAVPTATHTAAPTVKPTTAPTATHTIAPTATHTVAPAAKATATPVAPEEKPTAAVSTATKEPVAETPAPTRAAAKASAAPQPAKQSVVDCAAQGREHAWETFGQGDAQIRVCTRCGAAENVAADSAPVQTVFQTVKGAAVENAPQDGELVLLAAKLPENQEASGAFTALTVSWEQAGQAKKLDQAVRVSVPVTIAAQDAGENTISTPGAFKLVRVEESAAGEEQLIEVDFEYADGVLTFDMDQAGVYLLIPA